MDNGKVDWPLDRHRRLTRVILPQAPTHPPGKNFAYSSQLLCNALKWYYPMESLNFKAMSRPILIAGKYQK